MKIGEAQKVYRSQRAALVEQRRKLTKQKEALENKNMSNTNEAAILELSIDAVTEKFEENQKVLDKLTEQYVAVWNMEVTRQQNDTMSEHAADLAKIMEVARRIGKGAKVPASDEKKLMDYSMEMYMSAKNLAMLNKQKKREKYDSLWEEEKEKQKYDPQGKAENTEAYVDLPEPDIIVIADSELLESGGEI